MAAAKPFTLEQGLGWAALWAALDQTSKWAVVHFYRLGEYEAHNILPFLDFTLVWNSGVSYGLFGGNGDMGRWLLSGLAALAIGYFLWCLRHGESRRVGMGYALIAGGALGNLVDRLWYGAVVDFISLHWAGYYWFVFNLADIWISLAVVVLLADAFWPQSASKSPTNTGASSVAPNGNSAIDNDQQKEADRDV